MSNLRDQLLAIRKESGKLTPQIVVDAARPEDSPLHHKFEWNDAIAGEAFRRSQAAELIRSVRISYLPVDSSSPPASIRAFAAVHRPDVGHVYDPTELVLEDPLQRAILLRQMESDWRAMKGRYESIQEFWALINSEIAASA